MVAQLAHHGLGLLAHAAQELVVLRIEAAGEGEVLPHHDAGAIAPGEEGVVLVDVAAPAAQDVAVQVVEERQHLRIALGVAAVERIGRHPVAALAQDGHAVAAEEELTGLRRGGGVRAHQLDLPQADLVGALVHHLAVDHELEGDRVEVGRTVAPGPPQPRARHRDVLLARHEAHRHVHAEAALAADGAEAQAQTVERWTVSADPPVDAQARRTAAHLLRGVVYVLDARGRTHLQHHGPPDAGRDGARGDVPPVHVGRLAHVEVLVVGDHRVAGRWVGVGPRRADHRSEAHGELVGPAGAQQPGDVEGVLDEHVGRLAHDLVIEPHRGQAVQAVEDQAQLLPGGVRRRREARGVPPLTPLHLAQAPDLVGEEDIGQKPGAHEVQLDVARHLGWHAGGLDSLQVHRALHRVLPLREPRQGPRAVQADAAHRCLLYTNSGPHKSTSAAEGDVTGTDRAAAWPA